MNALSRTVRRGAWRGWATCLVASMVSSLVAGGCRGRDESSNTRPAGGAPPCTAQIVTVEEDASPPTIRIVGAVEPLRRASPAARVMATATRADFREGDRVRQGQVLVQLDTRDLTTAMRQARTARDSTQTALGLARANVERMRALHASGDVPRPQLEQAEAALAQAEAAAASGSAAVDTVDVNLSYARVLAPFDGVVALRLVEVGNLVAPGQPVAVIEDDTRLRVVAPIGTDLARNVAPGREVTVEISEARTSGKVESVASSGDARAPGLRLQVIVENADRAHRPGMVATVELPRDGKESAAARIPRAAIFERGQLTGVFVVNDQSEARLRWVVIGEDRGDAVRVLSGLRVGEQVAVAPDGQCLSDGRRVTAVTR